MANKKAKRSEGKAARRSPRLHSGDEGRPVRKGRASQLGLLGQDDDDDESDYQDGQVVSTFCLVSLLNRPLTLTNPERQRARQVELHSSAAQIQQERGHEVEGIPGGISEKAESRGR